MKILLTGANGYIGQRLLPALLQHGHEVYCLVRDARRFHPVSVPGKDHLVHVVQADLLQPETLQDLPKDISSAYYLVHSMGSGSPQFEVAEAAAATNFREYLEQTQAQQLIYLSGISNEKGLSKHLASRLHVEQILQNATVPLTVLRASIIIGSGSASFEIIRDLVEKLPVMVTPRWLNSRCQPIAIRDVLFYLTHVLGNPACYHRGFDIGGPEILTYKEMLMRVARIRGLHRAIFTLPVLTPRLSSYWLYFITSTSFSIARNLVESLRNDTVVKDNSLETLLPHTCLPYDEAVRLAFGKIKQNDVVSSWYDALGSGRMQLNYLDFIQIPEHGVFTDRQVVAFARNPDEVLENIWQIGGKRGWYKTDFLWKIRGFLDKAVGGVGLRRGRRHPSELRAGDSLDFWRVLLADKPNRRLLLYAEMKVPGDAWLQFHITGEDGAYKLEQVAAFRPKGLLGRLYWYAMLPFHLIIFSGMAHNLVHYPLHPKSKKRS